jgi:hypothetical protein
VSASRLPRFISALLLLCFTLTFVAPVFALYASQAAKMSCCKPGQASCCRMHSKQRTETGWTAAEQCPRQCGMTAAPPLIDDSLLPAATSHTVDSVRHLATPAVEENQARSTSYLAFLYQLPPPVPAC